MAVWAVLLPLLLGCLQFQARLVLELAASYMIVATLNWMLMACRALCAWQGSIRQADGGIISPVKLDQIGLMKGALTAPALYVPHPLVPAAGPAPSPAPGVAPLSDPLFSTYASCAGSGNLSSPSCAGFTNPLIPVDFADPGCFYFPEADPSYWCYSTNSHRKNIQVAYSSDLSNFTVQVTDGLPVLPSWAGRGKTWAPEVAYLQGQYVMYFSARNPSLVNGSSCIGVATASTPAGPFNSSSSEALTCNEAMGGMIDPSPFVDTDGSVYLLYKNDGLTIIPPFPISLWVAPLTPDGLSFEPNTRPAAILQPQYSFQGAVIEAPQLHRCGQAYCLFYSSNCYRTTSYNIGFAVARNITGPYTSSQQPLVQANTAYGDVLGPGNHFASSWHCLLVGWPQAAFCATLSQPTGGGLDRKVCATPAPCLTSVPLCQFAGGESVLIDEGGTVWMMYHSWYAGGGSGLARQLLAHSSAKHAEPQRRGLSQAGAVAVGQLQGIGPHDALSPLQAGRILSLQGVK
eukprot:jgi/Astpho2/6014/Aster-03971